MAGLFGLFRGQQRQADPRGDRVVTRIQSWYARMVLPGVWELGEQTEDKLYSLYVCQDVDLFMSIGAVREFPEGFTLEQYVAARRHSEMQQAPGVVLAEPQYGADGEWRTATFTGAGPIAGRREATRIWFEGLHLRLVCIYLEGQAAAPVFDEAWEMALRHIELPPSPK